MSIQNNAAERIMQTMEETIKGVKANEFDLDVGESVYAELENDMRTMAQNPADYSLKEFQKAIKTIILSRNRLTGYRRSSARGQAANMSLAAALFTVSTYFHNKFFVHGNPISVLYNEAASLLSQMIPTCDISKLNFSLTNAKDSPVLRFIKIQILDARKMETGMYWWAAIVKDSRRKGYNPQVMILPQGDNVMFENINELIGNMIEQNPHYAYTGEVKNYCLSLFDD